MEIGRESFALESPLTTLIASRILNRMSACARWVAIFACFRAHLLALRLIGSLLPNALRLTSGRRISLGVDLGAYGRSGHG